MSFFLSACTHYHEIKTKTKQHYQQQTLVIDRPHSFHEGQRPKPAHQCGEELNHVSQVSGSIRFAFLS